MKQMSQVEFDRAVESWTKTWQKGDPLGALDLGMAYYSDKGANKDFAKAIDWWQKAAQKGDSRSCYFLGRMCFEGDGVEEDFAKAVEWWTKAAESLARAKFRVSADQDAFPAQLALGLAYHKGDGVPKDEAKAVEIWSKVDVFWPKAFVGKWKRR